jgi:hypothetical protein
MTLKQRDNNLPVLSNEEAVRMMLMIEQRHRLITMKTYRNNKELDKKEIMRRVQVKKQQFMDTLYFSKGYTMN